MAQPLELPLFPDVDLDQTFTLRVTALSPTDGSVVAGVKVGAVTLIVDNMGGGDLTSGTFERFQLVPGVSA